jgi:hypothetical protein
MRASPDEGGSIFVAHLALAARTAVKLKERRGRVQPIFTLRHGYRLPNQQFL